MILSHDGHDSCTLQRRELMDAIIIMLCFSVIVLAVLSCSLGYNWGCERNNPFNRAYQDNQKRKYEFFANLRSFIGGYVLFNKGSEEEIGRISNLSFKDGRLRIYTDWSACRELDGGWQRQKMDYYDDSGRWSNWLDDHGYTLEEANIQFEDNLGRAFVNVLGVCHFVLYAEGAVKELDFDSMCVKKPKGF